MTTPIQDTEITIIVGGGHGGSQCTTSLRAVNYDGEIVLIDADDADLPYHKPPVSKKYLVSEAQTAVPLRSAPACEKAEIVRISDTVTSIDTDQQVVSMPGAPSRGRLAGGA